MHWIYLIHEFHNLSWITEINELFHDILIYWDAPVYTLNTVHNTHTFPTNPKNVLYLCYIVIWTFYICNDSLLALESICSLFIKQENIHSQYRTQHEQYRGTDRIRMVKQFQDRGRRRTYVDINMQRVRAGGNPRESGQNPRLSSERQAAIYQGTLN